jgi:hypothetical protein
MKGLFAQERSRGKETTKSEKTPLNHNMSDGGKMKRSNKEH